MRMDNSLLWLQRQFYSEGWPGKPLLSEMLSLVWKIPIWYILGVYLLGWLLSLIHKECLVVFSERPHSMIDWQDVTKTQTILLLWQNMKSLQSRSWAPKLLVYKYWFILIGNSSSDIEAAFATAKQNIEAITRQSLMDPALSTLAARLSRQKKMITLFSAFSVTLDSNKSAKAFKTLVTASHSCLPYTRLKALAQMRARFWWLVAILVR